MLDTMTGTKLVGGLCGTFLVFLFANWGAEVLYGTGSETPHHAEAMDAGYPIAAEEGGGTKEKEAPFDITTIMASADASAGEAIFKKCSSCHKLDGNNATGPHLNGVIGRVAGSVEGFPYSNELQSLHSEGRVWDPQHFSEFLTDPKAYAPGTKMAIKLPKPEDRANLIAFLETQK